VITSLHRAAYSWQFSLLEVMSSPPSERMRAHRLDFSRSFWLMVEETVDISWVPEELKYL
jgi:hypothetical protein